MVLFYILKTPESRLHSHLLELKYNFWIVMMAKTFMMKDTPLSLLLVKRENRLLRLTISTERIFQVTLQKFFVI